jgi:methyl-accepting chemotaxis protein
MSKIAATIASAIEEQGAATSEISCNVQQAAGGTKAVSENIGAVAEAARHTGGAASEVLEAVTRLTQQSDVLRRQVDRFLGDRLIGLAFTALSGATDSRTKAT